MELNTKDMTADDLARLAESLTRQAEARKLDERKAAQDAARKAEAEKAKAHYDEMLQVGQDLAGLNEAQHSIVYNMAYEHGHASGLSEVSSYYGDFAEMARKIIEAN